MLRIDVLFIIKTLPYSFCACVRNTTKIVTFFHWKDETGVLQFVFRRFAPLDPKRPLHML